MARILFAFLFIAFCIVLAGLEPAAPVIPKNVIAIQSDNFRQIPAGLQGDFTVSSSPPTVEIIFFSGLTEGNDVLWSSWGDGYFASNKRYYTAIGDHLGYNGKSYLYEYDPTRRILTRIVDVAESIRQKNDEYGHGKIHAQLQEHNKALYFATYWGKQGEVEQAYTQGYKGSLLFRYDLQTRSLTNLGAIAPKKGLPGSILDPNRGLLYFYGVEGEKGDVVVYDLKKRIVKFQGGNEHTADHRTFMLDKNGKVYFSDANGKLSFYDPGKNAISTTELVLPGADNRLRASSAATSKGIIFGMTRAGRLFSFDPAKQTINDLGNNFHTGEYNAAMVLSPDEKYLYFAPGSHGSAATIGTPVIQYNIAARSRKVIAFLHQPVLEKADYYIAGNYNLRIDPQGATLYGTFNGSKPILEKDPQEFGLPCVVVIKIPKSER